MSRNLNIDTILDELDKETILKKIHNPHYEARGFYQMKKTTVSSYNEFLDEVQSYYKYHYKKVISPSLPLEAMVFGEIKEILVRYYGSIASAQRLAEKGDSGGLIDVFNKINEALIKKHEKMYVDYIIDTYIDPTDYELISDLMTQFMSKYRDVFPEEMRNRNLPHIVHNYRKYLEAHLRIVGEMKKGFRQIR